MHTSARLAFRAFMMMMTGLAINHSVPQNKNACCTLYTKRFVYIRIGAASFYSSSVLWVLEKHLVMEHKWQYIGALNTGDFTCKLETVKSSQQQKNVIMHTHTHAYKQTTNVIKNDLK